MQINDQFISVPPPGQNDADLDSVERRRQLIATLLRNKPRSLSELCRELRTSASIIHKDLREMVRACIIFKKPRTTTCIKPGRPAVYYDLVTKRVRVLCPECRKTGSIEVNKDLMATVLNEQGTGLLDVHVFAGEICCHDLAIIIDANFMVRSATIRE